MGCGGSSCSVSGFCNYIETPLSTYLGWFPAFSGTPFGLDVLTAGIILAIMIIPTVSSVSREVIQAVPNSIREGAYSIGATKWEVIRNWVLSYGRSGLFGAVILGLGRASRRDDGSDHGHRKRHRPRRDSHFSSQTRPDNVLSDSQRFPGGDTASLEYQHS